MDAEMIRLADEVTGDETAEELRQMAMLCVHEKCTYYGQHFARAMRLSLDDLMQDACVQSAKWADSFDPELSRFSSHIQLRFKFFCRDFARDRVNHPDCKYTNRHGRKVDSTSADTLIRDTENCYVRDRHEFSLRDRDPFADVGFHELLRSLSMTQRMMMIGIYLNRQTMREVGKDLSLSESRISQLHKETVQQIRDRLRFESIFSGRTA